MPSTPDLPPIDPDIHRRLAEDILKRGVLVPILQAEDGEVLDGRLRLEIAQEYKLFCPKIIVGKLTPAERADLRLCVNLYRRHLSQAQARELIAWAIRQGPGESDRRVAERCGVDHKTVGGVRRRLEAIGEIPQLDSRETANGKRYPSARKPVVITSSESQAREASRLLGELGEEAPDRPLNVRDLRTLRYEQARDELLARGARKVNLGDDFQIHGCDFRKLGNRIGPGSVSLLLTDPPWGSKLGPEIAEAAVRLLKPDGLLA